LFLVTLDEKPVMTAQDDVASIEWISIDSVDIDKFAFESAKVAFKQLVLHRG
jgi:hypothetical protein